MKEEFFTISVDKNDTIDDIYIKIMEKKAERDAMENFCGEGKMEEFVKLTEEIETATEATGKFKICKTGLALTYAGTAIIVASTLPVVMDPATLAATSTGIGIGGTLFIGGGVTYLLATRDLKDDSKILRQKQINRLKRKRNVLLKQLEISTDWEKRKIKR